MSNQIFLIRNKNMWQGFKVQNELDAGYNDSFYVCNQISKLFEIDEDAAALQIIIHKDGDNTIQYTGDDGYLPVGKLNGETVYKQLSPETYLLNGKECDELYDIVIDCGLEDVAFSGNPIKFDIWQIY